MPHVQSILIDLPPLSSVPCISGDAVAHTAAAYLTDESRLVGSAERVFFPEDTAQVASVVRWAQESGVRLTVSGARTGITGGAVPNGGAVLSCERLRMLGPATRSDSGYILHTGAGVTIEQAAIALKKRAVEGLPDEPLFYPPDPTEATAEIGGTIACNASGARTFRYGPTRSHVAGLTVVLPTGDILKLRRGEAAFDDAGRIVLQSSQGEIFLQLPEPEPRRVRKNVAGFFSMPGMDLVDLFIGSEGVLGVVTEADLRLSQEPAGRVSAMLFFDNAQKSLAAVKALRGDAPITGVMLKPESIEFFDGRSLALLHRKREEDGAGSAIPLFPYPSGAALFTEIPYQAESDADGILEALLTLAEAAGVPEDRTWVATGDEGARMKAFRHALPETVNSIIGQRKKDIPDIHKVGTDLAVPDGALDEFLDAHYKVFEGFEFVVFGHIGDNHLHANILPRNADELKRAKAAYKELVNIVLALGGTVAAEHGIGKLKVEFLKMMLSQKMLAGMKRIKDALDPKGVLSPGNIFGGPLPHLPSASNEKWTANSAK